MMRIVVSIIAWTVLLVFLARSLSRLPSAEEWKAFLDADALKAFFFFALMFTLALVLRAYRFGILMRQIAPLPWREIAAGFPWLFLIGAVTPFRLGEGMRGVWASKRGLSASAALGYWVAERMFDLIALSVITIAGFTLSARSPVEWPLLVVFLGAVAVFYVLLWGRSAWIASLVGRLPTVGSRLKTLVLSFAFMQNARLHALTIGLTLAIWIVMTTGFWGAFTLLLDAPVPFALALAVTGAVNFAALLSGAPANVGSFQAAVVVCFLAYGLSSEAGLMASVVPQTAGLMTTVLFGFMGLAASRSSRFGHGIGPSNQNGPVSRPADTVGLGPTMHQLSNGQKRKNG
ncbi:MAG: lysylphosphatidylglycerol synthase transmembrane domain-containing protein [Parvularcula sp.]|jgi:uncharacterized membrane protein YbhN (UPF0104 family)|nr:lysylphosphatidylglycerol synthase transmembrane domain-containing protein [Parvularcula sp.]